ncbi:sugar-binding domain-containing protein [Kineococcus endophyticus]|uniref:Sugar-binding domain-containing protein n=1 Tax=Kineococcus endophyticus TaxID=1181883 RepID=A0ABV3P8I9_9ACTN
MKLTIEEQVQSAVAARKFYLEGTSKSDIADVLGVSRFRVARLLDAALEQGIVQISVQVPFQIEPDLSEELRRRHDLRRAIVVQTSPDPGELRDGLGAVAAGVLGDLLTEDDRLGIAWGRTLRSVVAHLEERTLPRVTVTQLTGAAGSANDNCIDLVRRVAAVSGGGSHPIFAPLLLPDAATLAGVRRQTAVARTLQQHARLTVALLAVGAWPDDSQLMDLMPAGLRRKLLAEGVCAEVAGNLLREDGQELSSLSDQLLTVGMADLRRIPEVVVVAGGPQKARAVRAVLASGTVSTLITDVHCARALLID